MGWKTNLVLLAVVGGLGGYLYLQEPPKEEPDADPTQINKQLVPDGFFGVGTVHFQHNRSRPPVTLELDLNGLSFRVMEPVEDVASLALLRSIMSAYSAALMAPGYTKEEIEADPTLLKKIGLDEPRGFIELRYRDGENRRIEFGNPGVRKDEIWIRVHGEIYRTRPVVYRMLEQNPDDLREHTVFTEIAVGEPIRVRYERRAGDRTILHELERGKGGFHIRAPLQARANLDKVAEYLKALGGLRIVRFLAGGNQESQDPEKFEYQITLTGDRGTETLQVREAQGFLFGRLLTRGVSFELKRIGIDRLEEWFPTLRERRMLKVPEAAIVRLEIDPPGDGPGCVLVRNAKQNFRVIEPVREAATNPTPLGKLLHALTRLDALEFIDEPGPETGLGPEADPFVVRVFRQSEPGRPLGIHFGKRNAKGQVYARRSDETAACLVPADLVDTICQPWTAFVSRYPKPLTQNAFRLEARVPATATGPARKEIYVFEDSVWHRPGQKEENGDIAEVVDALKTLRAKSVMATKDLDPKVPVVRVRLLRNVQADSGEIFNFELRKIDGLIVLTVFGAEDLAYGLGTDQPAFRRLYDALIPE